MISESGTALMEITAPWIAAPDACGRPGAPVVVSGVAVAA